MGWRGLVWAVVAVLLAPPAAAAAKKPEAAPAQPPPPASAPEPAAAESEQPAHWAQAQIETVVAAGLMGPSVEAFRADEPLVWADLAAAVGVLTGRTPVVADPARPITVSQLDAWVVRALGLSPAAAAVLRATREAGLEPPKRIGVETVARLLGLRPNHEGPDETRELGPGDVATRAEAAYSLAKALEWGAPDLAWVGERVAGLAVPPLTEWQRRVLARAVRFVGYPYVWGGSSESRQLLFGVEEPGGFDCSGFTWRVYKTESYDGAPQLGSVITGRTTFEMSAEVAEAQRIPLEQVQPGDLLFFGDRGPRSKPSRVGHMGILLAPGWMVHSSGNGTTIAPLEDWYLQRFAWARRPLAEAGLA